MQASKKTVKVSFQGETKRLKLTGDYQELIARVKDAWNGIAEPIKFFYLDEENEIISITSQSDFSEALEIEDLSSLKLTVAASVQDARNQLQSQIEEHQPLAESLSQAHMANFNQSRTFRDRLGSDFESIGASELDRSSTIGFGNRASRPIQHEIACGGDAPVARGLDMGTDVNNLISKGDQGCNTQRVTTHEKMIDTRVEQISSASQARAQTRDAANDGFATETKAQGIQMTTAVADAQANCQLLVPDDDDNEEATMQEVTCIKCNGSQVNKKGLPCRKCGGSGVLSSKELAAIAATVREEVRDYCYKSFQGMFKEFLEKKRTEQANILHENFVCDGCNMTPIKGIRYMCSVCSNYDICENCERNGVHAGHAMLKIRQPEHAPAKLICQYKNIEMNQSLPAEIALVKENFAEKKQAPAAKPKNPRYQARFVKESIYDKHEVEAGAEFTKTWVFRNDGETSWPADVKFLQTTGDDIGAKPVDIGYEVQADTITEVTVQCKAPAQEGRYTSYFRMQTGNIKFGHKVWCDILVVKPKQGAAVQMVSQEPAEEMKDKEVKEEVSTFQEAGDKSGPSSDLMQSQITIEAIKSPKMLYYEELAKETDEKLKEALTSLYEFGFCDFKVNKALMLKHKNVNTVAETLCNGVLGESELKDIYGNQ